MIYDRLNPTSNKSRIETGYQHHLQARTFVWIRLPTNQGLKLPCGSANLTKVNVWIRLPTNQGLKHRSGLGVFAGFGESESDFQQIKDWNHSYDLGNKKRSVVSESDFQQIKDWNDISPTQIQGGLPCLNPTSNKSRIETVSYFKFPLQWLVSLNPTSNKSRIETWISAPYQVGANAVWIRLPTNQGLKLQQFRTG